MNLEIQRTPDDGWPQGWAVSTRRGSRRVQKFFKTRSAAERYAADARQRHDVQIARIDQVNLGNSVAQMRYSLTELIQLAVKHLKLNGTLTPRAKRTAVASKKNSLPPTP